MKKDPLSRLLRFLVWGSAVLTAALVLLLIGFVLIRGVPHLHVSLFSWIYTSENVSLLPSLINTLAMTALALVSAVPLGVGAAVYLTEYANRGNRFVGMVRLTSETLAGIPSIVYGLFGMIFFVDTLGLGLSLLSGAATMAVMVLPLMMRTTEEALHSVPYSFREGSFGLGAGRMRTIFRIVLPSAVPGILSGVILSVGRVAGETAALLYTAGTVASLPENLFSSARTLAVHMYTLAGEGLHVDEAYATAVVLLGLVVLINRLSALAAGKWKKGGGHG